MLSSDIVPLGSAIRNITCFFFAFSFAENVKGASREGGKLQPWRALWAACKLHRLRCQTQRLFAWSSTIGQGKHNHWLKAVNFSLQRTRQDLESGHNISVGWRGHWGEASLPHSTCGRRGFMTYITFKKAIVTIKQSSSNFRKNVRGLLGFLLQKDSLSKNIVLS